MDDAFRVSKLLGRGINLGNALGAPSEGAWGLSSSKAGVFRQDRGSRLQYGRIPIRWATHAGPGTRLQRRPHPSRSGQLGDRPGALTHGLAAVINAHHDLDLYKEPDNHQRRLEATWRQIAESVSRIMPRFLVFELLDEPHGVLTDERWQALFPKFYRSFRESNPDAGRDSDRGTAIFHVLTRRLVVRPKQFTTIRRPFTRSIRRAFA